MPFGSLKKQRPHLKDIKYKREIFFPQHYQVYSTEACNSLSQADRSHTPRMNLEKKIVIRTQMLMITTKTLDNSRDCSRCCLSSFSSHFNVPTCSEQKGCFIPRLFFCSLELTCSSETILPPACR